MDAFKVVDQTGTADVKRWINAESPATDNFNEGDYIRIVGAVKSFQNKLSIQAFGYELYNNLFSFFRIQKMDHPDQIAHHLLSVTHAKLTMQKKHGNGGGASHMGGMHNQMMQGNPHLSRLQNEIIEFVKRANSSGGDANISRKRIIILLLSCID